MDAELYKHYREKLQHAVKIGGANYNPDKMDSFNANVAKFAAYKSAYAKQKLAETVGRGGNPNEILNAFNRTLDAECTTAAARARTAKQMAMFNEPERKELFPNLKWLPSRSVTPRNEHEGFYNRIWAKDDPFWQKNFPGTEWNCKCDIEETDEPTSDNSKVSVPEPPAGLEGNPDTTGEIFTNNAGVVKKVEKIKPRETVIKEANKISRTEEWKNKEQKARLMSKTTTAKLQDNTTINVSLNKYGYEEVFDKMGSSEDYLLKNEIAKRWDKVLENVKCSSEIPNDMTHNSMNNKRNKFKQYIDKFYYFPINVENKTFYAHVGHHNSTGEYFLWCITENIPTYR